MAAQSAVVGALRSPRNRLVFLLRWKAMLTALTGLGVTQMEQRRRNSRFYFVVSVSFVLITAHLSEGAKASRQVRAGQESTDRLPATTAVITTRAEYRIGAGDLVEVKVDKAPELSGTYRVSANGTFQMYFVGAVQAQDKTPEELTELIAGAIRGRYLRSPHVTVEVKQYNSRAVFVQGSVRLPGIYQLDGRVSLLKLISMCGGLADNHGS